MKRKLTGNKILYSMAMNFKNLSIVGVLFLTGCMTVTDQYGQTRHVMSPAGVSLVSILTSTAIGAGTGALMQNQPSWAVGLASGAASGVANVAVEAVANPQYYDRSLNGYSTAAPPQYYQQPNSNTLYKRLPNGQFVAVQNY